MGLLYHVCVCVCVCVCVYVFPDDCNVCIFLLTISSLIVLIIFKMSVLGSFLLEFPNLLNLASLRLEKEVFCAMFVHFKCLYHFAL
jgi:hypothetical protein